MVRKRAARVNLKFYRSVFIARFHFYYSGVRAMLLLFSFFVFFFVVDCRKCLLFGGFVERLRELFPSRREESIQRRHRTTATIYVVRTVFNGIHVHVVFKHPGFRKQIPFCVILRVRKVRPVRSHARHLFLLLFLLVFIPYRHRTHFLAHFLRHTFVMDKIIYHAVPCFHEFAQISRLYRHPKGRRGHL